MYARLAMLENAWTHYVLPDNNKILHLLSETETGRVIETFILTVGSIEGIFYIF